MKNSKIQKIIIFKNNHEPGSGSSFFFMYLNSKYKKIDTQITIAFDFFNLYPTTIPISENKFLHFEKIYNLFLEKGLVGDKPLLIKGFYDESSQLVNNVNIRKQKLDKLEQHFLTYKKKDN
ncbi:hypothetical protein [Spiroplasma endosymbiont of Amphibalanus improvisus]|uniref:hypothetical protein n=1 Tax=Spiroplasma endosymbiont of Amphibalanus improvisus TaxID=3066327 RepID=UPI00313B2E53